MSIADKYVKTIEWSEDDACFVGHCPELLLGGCHGSDPREVFDELCRIVEETVEIYVSDAKPLPAREYADAIQRAA
jgi:predicted RNase H-like HicB family nuclease